MDFRLITVGIAGLKTASSPDILRTILGSCIGICLYDPVSCVGGLSHIMLPSTECSNLNKGKYADTAIPLLLEEMEKSGAVKKRIIAKIIGGAKMFDISDNSMIGNIGNTNIDMVRKILSEINIEIVAEDVGGDSARTIDFYIESGMIKVKSPKNSIKMI